MLFLLLNLHKWFHTLVKVYRLHQKVFDKFNTQITSQNTQITAYVFLVLDYKN